MLKIMYRIANITKIQGKKVGILILELSFWKNVSKLLFTNKRDPTTGELRLLHAGDHEKYVDSNNYDAEKNRDDLIRESIYELAHDLRR